ncbi:hypothetical protein Aduo_017663 [Ancylostoma duodenale]
MLAQVLPVLLFGFAVATDEELTKNEFLQTVPRIKCGITCQPIAAIDCGYDTEEENRDPRNECFAPLIEYAPRESCWTAKVRCEARGRPIQLRTDVEGTTFIQAVSKNPMRPMQMTVVCNENGRYVTKLGRPVDGVYCFAPNEDKEGSGAGTVAP